MTLTISAIRATVLGALVVERSGGGEIERPAAFAAAGACGCQAVLVVADECHAGTAAETPGKGFVARR